MIEHRQQTRHRVRWRAALRHESRPVLFGETIDVSMAGASIVADANMMSGLIVSLYLQIPPRQHGRPVQVVEVSARIQYTSFSPGHDRWRMGIQFLEFRQGQEALDQALRQLVS